jgi:hydroxymethylpyrimidine kinase/phosphomethylpyrimidine kinase/thiamine-phosphate diphosphorylase
MRHTTPSTDTPTNRLPIIWSIAGLDTAGGAGLSADQRAADALGVHLCPVVAAMTAQHSKGVQAVQPVTAAWLEAQLRALMQDMPPAVIKTGLLGSPELVHTVARWVDRLRADHPERSVALVVDPVLGASAGGTTFASEAVVDAYQRHLLPRATLLTPNRAEARRLLGIPPSHEGPRDEVPDLATALRLLGAGNVAITGGDAASGDTLHCLDWIDTEQAQGWLCAPRVETPHHHGTGCTFATGAAAALALGHTPADALVLAKMLTHHALSHGHAAGQGPGPVVARGGFARGPAHGGAPLPWLGLGRELPWRLLHPPVEDAPLFQPFRPPADGLYGIVDTGERIGQALDVGLRCLQLRHKAREGLSAHLARALDAATAQADATLFINDHWQDALAALPSETETEVRPDTAASPPLGVHLGQEDLLALSAADRRTLLESRHRLMLGLSSHSLWELARAAGCGASLIACGPVQPTTTKDMPWRPQGEDNLRWWVAHSPVPVVAIGGLLTPDDLQRFAACGPAALCVVRALDGNAHALRSTVPVLRWAVQAGRSTAWQPLADFGNPANVTLPHPVL